MVSESAFLGVGQGVMALIAPWQVLAFAKVQGAKLSPTERTYPSRSLSSTIETLSFLP